MYNTGPIFPQQQPKCCGCISLRLGSSIICLIWAAFSMYLAVLSFQNTSLFYSYLPQAPIMVFGVVNLILSLVSVGGLVILIVVIYVRTLSHAIFVSVFFVLVDGFINVILFITNQSNFYTWCINTSSQTIINANSIANNSLVRGYFDNLGNADYYNCYNLWQDELKFGIIFYILMFAFYVYWALCIYSFSLVRREYYTDADIRDAQVTGGIPMMGATGVGGLAVPPQAMINNGPAGPPFPQNDRSVIVLNNQKPRSKKKLDSFSFRNIKKSIVPSSTITPMQHVPFGATTTTTTTKRDSQFTIGFRLGPDGNIIDIENAPSPTPTFIDGGGSSNVVFYDSNQEQQQLKLKPITKKDHY